MHWYIVWFIGALRLLSCHNGIAPGFVFKRVKINSFMCSRTVCLLETWAQLWSAFKQSQVQEDSSKSLFVNLLQTRVMKIRSHTITFPFSTFKESFVILSLSIVFLCGLQPYRIRITSWKYLLLTSRWRCTSYLPTLCAASLFANSPFFFSVWILITIPRAEMCVWDTVHLLALETDELHSLCTCLSMLANGSMTLR